MKAAPNLFDELMRSPDVYYQDVRLGSPRTKMMQAHRFVLDNSASAFFGDLMRRAGPLVLREHEFARAPYPLTWIEFDNQSYMGPHFEQDDKTHDTQVGYLFDGDKVYLASDAAESGLPPMFSPYHYQLHRPISFEEELAAAQAHGTSRLNYRFALLGAMPERADSPWWMSPEATHICRSHQLIWESQWKFTTEEKQQFLFGGSGTLKQILGLALMLTKPGQRVISINEMPHHRAIIRGKQVVLAKHNKVTLHMKQRTAVRRFITGLQTGLHRRLHDVRGHWAQTRRFQRDCTHWWEPTDIDHYQCLRCQAKRWWRHAHKRGHEDMGTVTKDYAVTE